MSTWCLCAPFPAPTYTWTSAHGQESEPAKQRTHRHYESEPHGHVLTSLWIVVDDRGLTEQVEEEEKRLLAKLTP